jgi:hypothetical protein
MAIDADMVDYGEAPKVLVAVAVLRIIQLANPLFQDGLRQRWDTPDLSVTLGRDAFAGTSTVQSIVLSVGSTTA